MSDFRLQLEPGLTIDESSIEVVGKLVEPASEHKPVDLDQVVRSWAAAKGLPHADQVLPLLGAYGDEVHRAIVPSSSITSVDLTPVALQHELWDNSGGDGTGHYSADLSTEIKDGTTTEWNESATIGIEFSVGVEIGFGGSKAEASTNYSFSATVGHSTSHTREISVGGRSGVDYEVPAGHIDVAILVLQRGIIRARATFDVEYTGQVGYEWGIVVNPDGSPWIPPSGHLGRQGAIPIADLLPWLPHPTIVMDLVCDFAADAQIHTRRVPDTHRSTIAIVIDDVLRRMQDPK